MSKIARTTFIAVGLVAAQERVDTQLGQVENFVANEVDGLIVIAVDAEATDPMTKAGPGRSRRRRSEEADRRRDADRQLLRRPVPAGDPREPR